MSTDFAAFPPPALAVTYRIPGDPGETTVPVHRGFFKQGTPVGPDGEMLPPEWFVCGVDPRTGSPVLIPAAVVVRLGGWNG